MTKWTQGTLSFPLLRGDDLYVRTYFFPLSRGIRGGLVIKGMEIGLAQDLTMTEDEVLSQTTTMGVEDVLETVAPVPREELVVVAAASEAEEPDADDLADRVGWQDVEDVIAAPDERILDDTDHTLLTDSLGHSTDGARAASCRLGQVVH